MNIKQEEDIIDVGDQSSADENIENDPHAMNSALVLTTESDHRGNKEMLDIIENINETDDKSIIKDDMMK